MCLGLLMLSEAVAAQSVIRVPQDAATVQGAVDLAENGDVIRISKGSYFENVVIHQRVGLRLVGKGKVVLQGGLQSSMSVSGCEDIVLEKLTFANSVRHGLQVSGTNGLTVSRCFSIGNGSSGMVVNASEDVVIERCRLDFNGAYGIRLVDTERARIEKNKIFFCGVDGVELSNGGKPGPHEALVSRNVIKNTGRHGIAVFGVTGIVTNNKVMGVGLEGLVGTSLMGEGVVVETQAVFLRNRIKDVGRDGIRLAGFGCRAERNSVADAVGKGLEARGAGGHLIVRNKLTRTGDDGLQVRVGSDGCTLQDNRVMRAGNDGLDLQSAGNQVSGNRCMSSTAVGFGISGSQNTLTKNRALKSGAFDLSDRVGGNTYDGNHFKTVDPEGVVPD